MVEEWKLKVEQLPIQAVMPQLQDALRTNNHAVLVAPPGAGKSTQVPIALLGEPWLDNKRIIMLEPRRLAARSVAKFMATSLGEQVGETIGYRVKQDTRVGARTRIEVITEGVLTRMIQDDPALEDVGIVIFDEYHERNLHADLGLALCLQSQAVLRDDLRLLVMSATIEAEPVAALMGGSPIITSEGRAYPVETKYLEQLPGSVGSSVSVGSYSSATSLLRAEFAQGGTRRDAMESFVSLVARTVQSALRENEGDVLVFLPGAGEIRRVEQSLHKLGLDSGIRVAPLYGNMTQEAQDQAIARCPAGERKVVLATSIAETSLTVDGVRVVIDSGLMRVPRFSVRTGMMRLETVQVARASADQRQGRAGRRASGVCYRLWTEQEDRHLASRRTPEILEADLAPIALELALWGVSNPSELQWLDPIPEAAYVQAQELLQELGALDEQGSVTAHGRQMASLGTHPRLAHMMLRAIPLNLGEIACELAALLGERDIVRGRSHGGHGHTDSCDLRVRLDILRDRQALDRAERGDLVHGYEVDAATCKRIRTEADHWKRMLPALQSSVTDNTSTPVISDPCGLLVAFAYPDRIAQRRVSGGGYLLRNGRGAVLTQVQTISNEPYLAVAQIEDQQGAQSRIHLAAPIDQQLFEEHFADQIKHENLVLWDREVQAVRARKRVRLGAIIFQEGQLQNPDADEILQALLQGVAEEGLGILPWNRTSRQYLDRLRFMQLHDSSWQDVSEEALLASLDEWLAPHLFGMKSRSDLQRLNMMDVLQTLIPWDQQRLLDQEVPTHYTVPSGSRIPIDYTDMQVPVLAVRLQEMFGLTDTPRIANGSVPLTLHLLSPAQRPVQVTQDLASFWRGTYFEVRKDLKGRYPKHYWPDDPLVAMPTNRVRPKL
ncbi:ATP-dependent helicase HrpB [Paenibacillus sp. N1-5-1-14]|uniref:ATP-dependent helicase HrpB n=1 Tax=Paenibacillus radicibacter TaxID=2972488 RepID=UPI0021596F3A|nr:ATP-dependent helicase HrpB [Paenibacillus radicibacter]MCR8642711.1 ATP-dependent helicase HrpB [Paenibacillus radicibacter]